MTTAQPKCKCGHERKYHAIAENHVLGTTHCTIVDCKCNKFAPDGKNENKKAKTKNKRQK